MPARLCELVSRGDLAGFEARCLELLEAGELPLPELATCLEQLDQSGHAERVLPLAQLVFENIDVAAQPAEALKVGCAALGAVPESADLRRIVIDLYRRLHGRTPGFEAILASSGLTTGRAVRAALRVLDFCLALRAGDALISRVDGRVVEVSELDHQRGLFTLRRGDRVTTLPAREVVHEYDRIDSDDFRVLRQLRPDRLAEMIRDDPTALLIGLIHAHGERIDADQLKHELVPRYIDAKDWPKWWSGVRTQIKRCPHIIVEGRAPVVLRYSADLVSLEDQTWAAVVGQRDPVKWLSAVDGYLRQIKQLDRPPDEAFLARVRDALLERAESTKAHRPADALAWTLALLQLGSRRRLPAAPRAAQTGPANRTPDGRGLPCTDQTADGTPAATARAKALAAELLSQAERPADLIAGLSDLTADGTSAATVDGLWQRAVTELRAARPADWPDSLRELIDRAPASQLDNLAELLREAGRLEIVQQYIDDAVSDPLGHPELTYWLWKGPQSPAGLRLPSDEALLARTLETLAALGASLTVPADVARCFRGRMKAALALRGYARAVACLERCSPEAAVTLRRQLERLEGLGPNARTRLLEALRRTHPQLWIQRAAVRQPWEDPDVIWATPAGIQRKTAERDELLHVKMPENARRIGEAAAHGDLSENSEYRFALEERDLLRARLAQMNHDLSIARPLVAQEVRTDQVTIGTRVRLHAVPDGPERVLTILGPFETDIEQGIYNYNAPICKHLLGRRVGERVRLPDGQQEFEVVAVDNALQADA